jgi:tRNA G18 (ribose-2'-O)-methylase SpoU
MLRSQEETVYMIPGLHGVRESLLGNRVRIAELWISERKDSARIKEIIDMAEKKGVPVLQLEKEYGAKADIGRLKTRIQAFLERIKGH